MNAASEKTITQNNTYEMLDDCGRNLGYITASNVNEARIEAAKLRIPRYWKVRRCYNGGIMGSQPY